MSVADVRKYIIMTYMDNLKYRPGHYPCGQMQKDWRIEQNKRRALQLLQQVDQSNGCDRLPNTIGLQMPPGEVSPNIDFEYGGGDSQQTPMIIVDEVCHFPVVHEQAVLITDPTRCGRDDVEQDSDKGQLILLGLACRGIYGQCGSGSYRVGGCPTKIWSMRNPGKQVKKVTPTAGLARSKKVSTYLLYKSAI